MTSGPVQRDRLCRIMGSVEASDLDYRSKEEERMNKWNPLNRLLAVLNTVLDEFLQFACLACQAVPWFV